MAIGMAIVGFAFGHVSKVSIAPCSAHDSQDEHFEDGITRLDPA